MIGYLVGAGAGLLSSLIGAKSQKKLAKQQMQMMQKQLDFEKQKYDEYMGRMKPFYEGGVGALGQYQGLLSGSWNPESSPLYQMMYGSAQNALNASLRSRGLQSSGGAAKLDARTSAGIASDIWSKLLGGNLNLMQLGIGANVTPQSQMSAVTNMVGMLGNQPNVWAGLGGALTQMGSNYELMDALKGFGGGGGSLSNPSYFGGSSGISGYLEDYQKYGVAY